MERILMKYLVYIIGLLLGAYLIEGIQVEAVSYVMIFGLILFIINGTLKPILLLLAIPINLLTIGLFSLVINAWMIQLTAKMTPKVIIADFWSALLLALIIVLFKLILDPMVKRVESRSV